MEQTLQDLRSLLTLFEEPTRWTKGCTARNGLGESVLFDAEDARSWCLFGGCRLIGGERWYNLDAALIRVQSNYPSFNDSHHTNHQAIIAFIRDAIELEKQHG